MPSASTNSSAELLPPDPLPFGGLRPSVGGDTVHTGPQPFWGRLFRALFLLAIAALAHLWLGRAAEHRASPSVASAPSQPAINAVVQALDATASAATSAAARETAPAGVTVRTQLVPVATIGYDSPASGARPLPPAAPQAVGTAGILAADQRGGAPPEREPVIDHGSAPMAAETTADVSRRNEDAPDAQPQLTPLAATRRLLPELPKTMSVNAPAPRPAVLERVIHTAPIVEPDQRQLVNRVLQEYAAAYERLDVAAAKEVYPSVNDTALRRAFSQLEAQRVSLGACGITISGSDANAHCKGEATYLPSVGPRKLQRASREWTFNLAKADTGWHIVRATVR